MKEIDKVFLAEISSLACIIPIISKADCMTTNERRTYLQQVHCEIEEMRSRLLREVVFNFHEDIICGSDSTDRTRHDDVLQPSRELIEETYDNNNNNNNVTNTNNNNTSNSSNTEIFEIDYSHAFLPTSCPDSHMGMSYSTVTMTQRESFISPESNSISVEKETKESSGSQQISQGFVGSSITHPPPSNRLLLPVVPNVFAVICSSEDKEEEGQQQHQQQEDYEVLRRVYPWGSIDIEDETLSDFRRLQRLVFESEQISEMRDQTQQLTITTTTAVRGESMLQLLLSTILDTLARSLSFVVIVLVIAMVSRHFCSYCWMIIIGQNQ